LAYTLAGALSSTLVGAALGSVGAWLQRGQQRWPVLLGIALLAFGLAAREWGWINFPIPERKLQTEQVWAHEFGFVGASALWGFHIGLTFMTRVTYGGVWALATVTLALADPPYGAAVMLAYWLGRTLPVWLAPMLNWSGPDASQFPQDILAVGWLYHRLAGFGLIWSGGVVAWLAFERLSGRF
jgi:cytochrome c biogenesis protein CcdA